VDLKNWIRGGLPSFKNSPKKNMPSEEIGREEGFYRATEDWDLPETVRNRAFSGLFCLHPISLERLLPVLVGRELRRIVLNLEGSGRYQFLRDVLRLVPFDSLREESLNEESDVSLTEVIHTMSCLWLIGCGLDDLWDDGPVGREAGQRMWKHLQAARVAALEEGLLKGVVTMRILRDAGTERERRATEPIWRAIQKTIGED
jgi:hypothetical protein